VFVPWCKGTVLIAADCIVELHDRDYSGDKFKKDNIWWWGLWQVRGEGMCVEDVVVKPRERGHLVEVSTDGRRILKLIFKVIECGGDFSRTANCFSLRISFSIAVIHLKRHKHCPRKRF